MQGRTYYVTTLSAWQVESAHFTTSHYLHADPRSAASPDIKILALVEADEGTHNSLSQNPAWQELPHPLSPKIIPEAIANALSPLGVTPFDSSFELTESVAKLHPIMRHHVF
jgi:hypothetical protein